MKTYKIGQLVTCEEDTMVVETLGQKKLIVKKGDKGIITANGLLSWQTGEARGMKQMFDKTKVKIEGYDVDNIINLIVKALVNGYCCDEDDEEEIRNAVESVLWEIF